MVEPIQASSTGEANQTQIQTPTPAPAPAPVEQTQQPAAEAKQEKLLPQSEVNELVGKVKREAAEKARRDALLELQKATAANPVMPQYGQPPLGTQPDAQQSQQIAEILRQQVPEMVRQQAQFQAKQMVDAGIAQEFMAKITPIMQQKPEFEKNVLETLNYKNLPIPLVQVLNTVDNVDEVLTEMADNPTKFADVMNSFYWSQGNPALAQKAVQKISESIKQNKLAKAQPQAPEPLSQVQPSTTGTDNGAPMSVAAFKKASWLRG